MRTRLFVLAMALALCAASFGQEKKPAEAPKTAEAAKPAPPPAAKEPEPTELERTQIENLQLRMALLQQEEQSLPQRKMEIQQKYGAIVQQIQHEHPGYLWNPGANNGQGGLVAEPKKAEAPKK